MKRVVILATVLLVLGCGKLSKDEAARILKESKYKSGEGYCTWQAPQKSRQTDWSYTPFDAQEAGCMLELSEAGLASDGKCMDAGCTGGCCKMGIVLGGKAKFDRGVSFACGKFSDISVTSVRTEDATATVKASRVFTSDRPLLDKLKACKLNMPQEGAAELSWKFAKDDDGTWQLVE